MKPAFILMLTYNDTTVKDALKIFRECKDAPVSHWGFKDVGLPPEEMKALVHEMKNAGKTTYLEVVSLSEEEGLRGAQIAVDAGFDILMGTVFFDSILNFLKGKPIQYYPFPGHIYGHPSIMDGTIEEIVAHAKLLEGKGVQGMDLLSYRYVGDAPLLLREVVKATHIPIVSAGSIDSYKRLAEVWQAGAWGFTIGSALFDKKFVPNGSFLDNTLEVCNWLEKTGPSQLDRYLGK
jgi:2,4-dienoyl-CoA reductase-like NADH-dependent reductase (Old Yellow Enzyme family)